MGEVMKAIFKHVPDKGAELRDTKIPTINDDEVLVKIKASSICGSDVHVYNWNEWAQSHVKVPQIMGHEFIGDIVEVGKNVRNAETGDYVTAETHVVCNTCYNCLNNQKHICQNYKILGIDMNGSFADYVAIPSQNIWKTDKNIKPEIACLQEPFGNSVHATLIEDVAGKTVGVFGAGPTGLFSIAIAKASGANLVVAADINDYRLDLAKKMGADIIVNTTKENVVKIIKDATNGHGADVTLEMAGHADCVCNALKSVAMGGRMCFFGLAPREVKIDVSRDIIQKGIRMYGIIGRRMFETWHQVSRIIHKVDLEKIITHKFALEQFEDGMDLMNEKRCGKVVLFP